MSRETGQPRSGAGDATAGAWGPACGRATARRCGSPWAGFTGLAPRQQRFGTDTWTERCAPAREPPAKCSPPEDRRARDTREVQPEEYSTGTTWLYSPNVGEAEFSEVRRVLSASGEGGRHVAAECHLQRRHAHRLLA